MPPHRFGVTWSSKCAPQIPAASRSRIVRADIQLIPIACVRVDKKGQIHTGGKVLGVLCLFTSADKTQIRHTQQAGCCCLTAM